MTNLIRITIAAFLYFVIMAGAFVALGDDEKPEAPKPHAVLRTAPARFRFHFDSGWLARAHWAATAFDNATTGLANAECLHFKGYSSSYLEHYCGEQNPLERPFIGYHHNPSWRLALDWAGESAAVSLIPNKKLRRVAQISLIGSHLFFGARNLKYWH